MDEAEHAESLRQIIGVFFHVYNRLGHGFLESHYAAAMEREMRRIGLSVAREYAVRVWFDDEPIGFHRLDMVVNDTIVVELKASAVLPPQARQQVYNYLRATSLDVGLILHFGLAPRFHKLYARDLRPVRQRRRDSGSSAQG